MRPEDDYNHPVGAELNFNESMYFHFHDAVVEMGGFVRLANRPNEGRGEMTVCLYLPDGRLGFAYARPEGRSNERFDAAGMRFSVHEPGHRMDVTFAGEISVLDDAARLDDPSLAFRSSPRMVCSIDLTVDGLAAPFDHSFDASEDSFAPNHYEQLIAAKGTLALAGRSIPIEGYGLRDHSWGPRSWQAPWFYRWIHGCGPEFGFMGAWFGSPQGPPTLGGFVWDGAALFEVDSLEIGTRRNAREEQADVTAVLCAGDREWKIHGSAKATAPLRNRRTDEHGELRTTRIVEALMRWTLPDGRVLQGMSEYLDQLVDGRPVGLAV
ncbi:DUF7065 domain-containing protein [Sciscionella marina]|uniref:DUF7065 domain-containing protein n=1 Tax=Sciscionella marina TaxID=508770 RepID=UPI00037ACC8B|nr:hypothetical protein [Sciscionella marina]